MSQEKATCFILQALYCGSCGNSMSFAESETDDIPVDLPVHPPFVRCTNSKCENHGKLFHRPRFILEPVES